MPKFRTPPNILGELLEQVENEIVWHAEQEISKFALHIRNDNQAMGLFETEIENNKDLRNRIIQIVTDLIDYEILADRIVEE